MLCALSLALKRAALFKNNINFHSLLKNYFMAKVGNSIFDIQGRLGDLIYYRYKGKPMVKRAPAGKRTNSTQVQLEQQAKFAAVSTFLRSLYDFLKVTYKVNNRNRTSYQKAFSENYREAVNGIYPSFTIDFSKVRLGNGHLSNAMAPVINSPEPGKLVFSWGENDKGDGSMSSDQFYVAMYSETLKQWIFNFKTAERYKKFCRVDAASFSGTSVHIYIGFVSADGNRVSTPLYTGALTVS
jgi:hypothetical protein